MKRGDMAQIEQEIEALEEIAWRKLLAMGAAVLFGNMASMAIGVFFGFLVWGI